MNARLEADQAAGWRDAELLLANSAKLNFFVMLRRTLDGSRLPLVLGEHLRWLIAHEQQGHVFLSGPAVLDESESAVSSMILFRTATKDEALALAQGDPFVRDGILSFELFEWTAHEGSISLTVTLSDSSVKIA